MRVVLGLLAALAATPAVASDTAVEAPAEAAPSLDGGTFGCRRSIGFAGGAYDRTARVDWDQVGTAPWGPTVSPVLGASCGHDGAKMAGWVGVETAPWFIHINPDGEIRRQWATTTGTLLFGPRALRVGPHATFGFTGLGGGLSAMWTPSDDEDGGPGLVLRMSAYRVGATGLQGMLLYTTTPKRSFLGAP